MTKEVKAQGDVTKATNTLDVLHKIMVEAKEKKEVEQEKQIAAREIAANSAEAAAQQVQPSAQGGDKATKEQSADDELKKGMTVDAAGNIAVQVTAVSPATSSSRAEDMRQDEWHKWKSALPVFAPEARGSGTASEVRTMQDQGIMRKSDAVHFKQKLTKLQKEAMEAKEKRQAEQEKQIAAREIAANAAEAAAQQAISTVQTVAAVDSKKKTWVAHHETQKKAESAKGESNRDKEAEIDLVQNAEASANRAASVAHIKSPKAANKDKSISEVRLAHKKLAQMAVNVLKQTPSHDVQAVQPGAVHVESGMAKWKQLEEMAKEHIAALEKRKAHSLAFMRQLAKTSSFQ